MHKMGKTVISYGGKDLIVEDMTKAQKKALKSERPLIFEKFFPTDIDQPAEPTPETEVSEQPENNMPETA